MGVVGRGRGIQKVGLSGPSLIPSLQLDNLNTGRQMILPSVRRSYELIQTIHWPSDHCELMRGLDEYLAAIKVKLLEGIYRGYGY